MHLLSAILAVLVCAGPSLAGPNRIILDPAEKVISPAGSKFSITLALDSGVRNVRFYNVHIAYDTTVISLDTIVMSPEWIAASGFTPPFFDFKDTITVDSATQQPIWYIDLVSTFWGSTPYIDGYAPLAELRFTAMKPGATFLYFRSADVLDSRPARVLSEMRDAIVLVCPYSSAFLGDFDHTGNVDIADLTFLIGFLYLGGPEPQPAVSLGDVNCDQNVDIGDVTSLIDYMFISFTPLCSLCP